MPFNIIFYTKDLKSDGDAEITVSGGAREDRGELKQNIIVLKVYPVYENNTSRYDPAGRRFR